MRKVRLVEIGHSIVKVFSKVDPMLWVLSTAPLLTRLALLSQQNSLIVYDLKGLLSDAMLVSLIYLIAHPLKGKVRTLAMVGLVTGFAGGFYANFENVVTLGSMVDLTYIKYFTDKTFFAGSAMAVQKPSLLIAILVIPLLFVVSLRGFQRQRKPYIPAIVFGICSLGFVSIDQAPDVADWRQQNFVFKNLLRKQSQMTNKSDAEQISDKNRILVNEFFTPDLSAPARIPLAQKGQNVLLIMLEGISGHYLIDPENRPTNAPPQTMPRLKKLNESHLNFSNFFTLQRQTNRGEYAILCGDMPNIVEYDAKMDGYLYIPEEQRRKCLPHVLKENGYFTSYIQAAKINFMNKDKFMREAGFDEVYGSRYFKTHYEMSHWGVDDRAYFEETAEYIKDINKKKKPWFVTMLTVGTHHPFIMEPACRGTYPFEEELYAKFADSVECADRHLSLFLDRLKKDGILDNTLVLITSDESAGFRRDMTGLRGFLSYSYGTMTTMVPDQSQLPKAKEVKDAYTLHDVPLSVLDYLGISNDSSQFMGRSLFRNYTNERPMVFANTYVQSYYLWENKKLHFCSNANLECKGYQPKGNLFTSQEFTEVDTDPERVEFLKSLVAMNDKETKIEINNMDFFPEDVMTFHSRQDWQPMYTHHYFDIPAHSQVTYNMEMTAEEGGLIFISDVMAERGKTALKKFEDIMILEGMTLNVNWEFNTNKAVTGFEPRIHALNRFDESVTVSIPRSHMNLESSLSFRSKLNVNQFEITSKKESLSYDLIDLGLLRFNKKRATKNGKSIHIAPGKGKTVVYGPKMTFPESKVAFRYSVKSDSATTLTYWIERLRDKIILLEKQQIQLEPGEPMQIEAQLELDQMTTDLNFGIQVDQNASFTVESAEVTFNFPKKGFWVAH